jgi:hypothetical protein
MYLGWIQTNLYLPNSCIGPGQGYTRSGENLCRGKLEKEVNLEIVVNKETKTVVKQYQKMETPGKQETGQVHCLLAEKRQAKEGSREDVLANKLTLPRAYTNWVTEGTCQVKTDCCNDTDETYKNQTQNCVSPTQEIICTKGSKTNGLKRKQGTKKIS